MKKRILLFTAIAGMAVAMLTSGKNGAGSESGYDCTGAETGLGNGAGCSHGSCHSTTATSGITVVLELDSAGVATTHYKAGLTYTVKITGTNTTSNVLPTFGFQVSCIQGSSAVATPTNAGTFASTGLPVGVQYSPSSAHPTWYACNMIEHNTPLSPTTGTGGTGSTYVESFQWTAPAAGTGTISFWGALNATNNDNRANTADLWNTTSLTINEWATTAVAEVTNNISISAFPNPVSNSLNLRMENTQSGTYSIQVVDMIGRTVTTENIVVTGSSHTAAINTGNWAPGTYNVVVSKDGSRQVIPVVKF